jgi:TonB family protein
MKRIHRRPYLKAGNAVWALLFAAIILATTAVAAFAAAEQNPSTESKYQKWLNQEVVYIITPQERVDFKKLKTDAERDKFIEQFWERRNPHPGNPVNTYKEGFYRQLAYANQHFATAGKAGWQTDRGHMLILHGPPDYIASPKAADPYPYEEWMYRYIQGVGNNVTLTFIDRSGEGDYQLASGPVTYPECIYCPPPQYTHEAIVHNFQGSTTLDLIITPEGRAEDIKAVKPLPYGLTEKAIEAVEKWKFKPAVGPNGKPAAIRQKITVEFYM